MAEANAADGHRPRRTYLVDRGFQLKYTLILVGVGLAATLALGLWMWHTRRQTTELAAADPALGHLLASGDLYAFAGIAVLVSASLGLLGLVVTHRVAGPLFVMGHYMSVLARGRFPRMRTLRRSDELRAFFRQFLDAVDALKAREARHAAMLEDAVERMRPLAGRAPELAPALEALEAAARERRAALAADDPELTPAYVPVLRDRGEGRP